MQVKVKKLPNFKGELPAYQTAGAAGMDLRAQLDKPAVLKPNERLLVKTGLAVAVPSGVELQVRPRSGLALKEGISVLNTPGTVDSDYRGEIGVILVNLGTNSVVIKDGDRIAQAVFTPVIRVTLDEVETLDETVRGEGAFGSTGV